MKVVGVEKWHQKINIHEAIKYPAHGAPLVFSNITWSNKTFCWEFLGMRLRAGKDQVLSKTLESTILKKNRQNLSSHLELVIFIRQKTSKKLTIYQNKKL